MQRVNLCLDTRGIETSEGAKSKYVSGYQENRDKKRCKEQICVWIPEESGQARIQKANLCLDTGRIGTSKGAKSKYVSRYQENRDKRGSKAQIYVWILEESGQARVQRANMCLDTGRIGTRKGAKSKYVSGYWKNWDKKRGKEQICVWILEESGQARIQKANMCLDTGRIGTSEGAKSKYVSGYQENRDKKGARSKYVSGYWKNRDKQGCKEQICVWILEELGQEKVKGANMCLDTGRIGTSKGAKCKYVSGYWKNRDKKKCKEQICVWIPGESGQARVQRANMCLDTGKIGQEFVIGVATGMEKVESVIGALNSHYLDVIIIDESTAAAVLERVTK
ncbi:hypothetical protein KDJ21_024420 [Metabacillus litoralis]|uniref:sugar-binding domain-containing protein n=2 Tax=Metabacillus TaxID=2675233 RepID=UPI001BA718E9|nr:sugar-binding domain-containing protein [Metabacillus litoralis]UHA59845.1 hypothetical protein KDJ21_024420 [Metabacillus litoralis]